jgi:hypothetical protein
VLESVAPIVLPVVPVESTGGGGGIVYTGAICCILDVFVVLIPVVLVTALISLGLKRR